MNNMAKIRPPLEYDKDVIQPKMAEFYSANKAFQKKLYFYFAKVNKLKDND